MYCHPDVYPGSPDILYANNGDGTFTDVTAKAGVYIGSPDEAKGLGVAWCDYDNDGDQDIVVTAYNDEMRLYRNDLSPGATNWLRIQLDTRGHQNLAPNGVGSWVKVFAGGRLYHRYITGCSLYLTQSELTAHFGLKDAQIVDKIVVAWPDGAMTVWEDVAVNRTITIGPPKKEFMYMPLVVR